MRRAAGDADTQMVLRDDLHGKVIFLHLDIGIVTHSLHQSTLYLGSRIVGMVQDTELRVPALPVQVEGAVILLVEIHAPVHEFLNLFGSLRNHLLYSGRVADIVARNHRVLDMLVEVIDGEICH